MTNPLWAYLSRFFVEGPIVVAGGYGGYSAFGEREREEMGVPGRDDGVCLSASLARSRD